MVLRFRPDRARTDHWKSYDDLLHGQLIKRNRKLTFIITRMTKQL